MWAPGLHYCKIRSANPSMHASLSVCLCLSRLVHTAGQQGEEKLWAVVIPLDSNGLVGCAHNHGNRLSVFIVPPISVSSIPTPPPTLPPSLLAYFYAPITHTANLHFENLIREYMFMVHTYTHIHIGAPLTHSLLHSHTLSPAVVGFGAIISVGIVCVGR